ncbi:hypothetical protein RRG08_024319 [Elysia crispata]|uniref:Uncharacterized protein n=1 Tax=Elysia crispata TaxID=231223 RepID=A0AAE1A3A7_9GAST|nr:hypothetical protein RRG08_024319 [Elysia crispata]
MAWSTVSSLLNLLLVDALSQPRFTPVRFASTNSCSDTYLVAGVDYILSQFKAAGSNATYPFNDSSTGPRFYFTNTTGKNPNFACGVFDRGTNKCTDRTGKPNSCSCFEVQVSRIYRFTYNMTAHRELSKQQIWMVWPGPPEIASEPYDIPEIRAKIELHGFESSFQTSQDFLVAGEDSTLIQIDVSGNNSVHALSGTHGPKFYYTTTDGVSHEGCLGFDPHSGSCTRRAGVRDACSCEMRTRGIYRLSYIKTATANTSRATVYLLWPGNPDLRSDNFTFPEIRDPTNKRGKSTERPNSGVTPTHGTESAPQADVGMSEDVKAYMATAAGVVALMAVVGGVGIVCNERWGRKDSRQGNCDCAFNCQQTDWG